MATTPEQMKLVHEGWHRAIVATELDKLMDFYAPDGSAVLVIEKDASGHPRSGQHPKALRRLLRAPSEERRQGLV
ncbi:hypothetical protein [Bradyrhizobium sp. CCBAU 11430]|uniref:hypothetical protein n=1 Tax=Bradyrhizobium sp. CCBAU 11430 TaxID=1630881 RepID=UPI0023051A59|nr:hypothetical protein [Bradyrhizobium sp. CCBAU 11430]